MNKAYLLVICLLLAPFTGCIEDSGLELVEDTDEPDNTEEEKSENEEKTEERPTEQWTFYRDFVECDPNNDSIVAYGEFVDCLNMDLRNDGESEVNASSEFANEMFSMADLDMDENLTSSEFDYIKFYPHETEESGGTGEACTGCSAECCEFCADTDGECPYDCVYNEDQNDNPSSCLAPDAGEDVEIIEEVPSVSLMSAMAVLGSIVIFRRKWV